MYTRPAASDICRVVYIQVLFAAVVILFAASAPVFGKPTTPHQAQAAVDAWLRLDATPLHTPMGHYAKEIQTYRDKSGTASYYVVYLEPEGFVIVAADDLVEPIVALASSGIYDTSADSCLAALVTSDMAGRMAEARETEATHRGTKSRLPEKLDKARRKWARLTSAAGASVDTGVPSVSDVRVIPLVQSRWNQTRICSNLACFNYFVPPYAAGSSSNYPCGCVATALAQLMRFFQHPTTGVGTASFSIKVDGATQTRNLRGGNGTGGPYNWASMVLVPGSNCSTITDAQRQAIGALCHDSGVAVNMQYASGASGAYTHQTASALKNTFMYSHARQGNNGNSNIGASLNAMINPNLDAGYPVILGVTGSSGGHAIVADGYGYNAATLYHHLNMGWAGTSDAWYNLPTIDAYYTFDAVHTCVYNIYVTGSGEIISGRVTDSFGVPISGATVTATRSGGGVYTATTNTQGIYALAKVPASSTYTVTAQKTGYGFLPKSVTTGTTQDMTTTCGNRPGIDFTAEGGVILTNIDALTVPEGGTAVFQVKLDNQPSGNVTVTTARTSGDSDIYIQAGSSITFNTSNWNTYQPVTIAAAQDGDALDTSAVIRCSAAGWLSTDVTAKEYDNDGQTVRYMKTRTDGSSVHCSRAVVTAVFGDHFYVEDEDRSCGILVHKAAHGLTAGIKAGIEGIISTAPNDERYIEASSVLAGDPCTIKPVGLSNSSLGGDGIQDSGTGAGQSGVEGGAGLNNIGLLVTTWGRISLSSENYEMSWNLNSSPGWSVQGQWAFGTPMGGGGTLHGFRDPVSGHTGTNVYGVNLNGDYTATAGGPHYLTTSPINLSGCSTVTLSYWRWLNADIQNYATETVAVSGNGANWTQIWSNSSGEITDSSWVPQSFNISSLAGNQPSVYLRWGHQTSDGVWAFSGWNMDDISLTGQKQSAVIDDGSGASVKLILPAGVSPPSNGAYAAVTGISCCEKDSQNKLRRVLKLRDASDIKTIP